MALMTPAHARYSTTQLLTALCFYYREHEYKHWVEESGFSERTIANWILGHSHASVLNLEMLLFNTLDGLTLLQAMRLIKVDRVVYYPITQYIDKRKASYERNRNTRSARLR